MKISKSSVLGLDLVSFFLANVRDGLGPYLAIYLLSQKNWNPEDIGFAMALPGFIRILFQSPAGAFIDKTRFKRGIIFLSSFIVALSCITMVFYNTHFIIYSSQIFIGIATSAYTPTVAAITLGIVGYKFLPKRIGRNESFNHLGNIFNAIAAGLIGYYISYEALFYLVGLSCIASSCSILLINKKDIDHSKARGATDMNKETHTPISPIKFLFSRNIILFGIAVTLFGFSNGSMLNLASQKLYMYNNEFAAIGISACIIVAQTVMVFVAKLTGKIGLEGNRKILFLLAFLVVPLRGFLYLLSNDPIYIIAIQVLDGIGGGIFGVLTIIMIADLTEGTGRFNLTQGVMTAIIGIGTSISCYITGVLAKDFNYNKAFLFLTAIGCISFLFVLLFIPNTKKINLYKKF
jgi:MFS family permease